MEAAVSKPPAAGLAPGRPDEGVWAYVCEGIAGALTTRELQIWIAEHLQTALSVDDLADRMSMSVRNFERVFTREVGTTPSQYVLQIRVEAARRELERTQKGLKQVASAAGFGNVEIMRRGFVRLLGLTPRRYRETTSNK